MHQLKILSNKDKKEILKLIETQWGSKLKLDFAILKNNKERYFIINKDIKHINVEKLRINSIGMYFCEVDKLGIRLSIEGSQIVGPLAKKNIVNITKDQAREWLAGNDILAEGAYSGFVLIKHNYDFLGTGKFKEGKVLNYVSKSRRVSVI